jgi:FKBP-type peptidyl-prolyl cis-trans isomerase
MNKKGLLAIVLGLALLLAAGCAPEETGDETEETTAEETEGVPAEEAAPVEESDMEAESVEAETGVTAEETTEAVTEEGTGEMAEMKFASIEELEGLFEWQETADGIKYFDVEVGDGVEVKAGDNITAFYTLWNSKGEMLQSNVGGDPFTIPVGVGRLIQGWDRTVPGMKEGGSRRLIVPGNLAYGENPPPNSGIAPDETLVFELSLVKTK